MMEYVPYSHLGNLYYGLKRERVRQMYGDYRAFKYGYPVENRYGDDFGNFHAYYSSDYILEAVALFPPCSFVCGGNKIVLSSDAMSAIKQLNSITEDIVYSDFDESYYSSKLGLVLFCPNDALESILIFDTHYYDEENEYLKKFFGETD